MEIKHDVEIARLYSEGKVIVDEIPKYKDMFVDLKDKAFELSKKW